MLYFGCLALLLVGVFIVAINLLSTFLNVVGGVVVYLWDSFCNLFRPKSRRREPRNPFAASGRTAGSASPDSAEAATRPQRGKIFDSSYGEYIDFEEIES